MESPAGRCRSNIFVSFKCAFAGLWYMLRTQRNARIHLAVAIAVVLMGLWLEVSETEWAILVLTIGVVLTAEALNTVAEAAVDLATMEYHPLAKVAKDVAAGAVLLMAMAAAIVGFLILGPPLCRVVLGALRR